MITDRTDRAEGAVDRAVGAVVNTATIVGIDAVGVTCEVEFLRRLPRTVIVGLPEHAAREVAECVRSAIEAAGFEYPRYRVIANLAPADVRKDRGVALAIAIGVAVALGNVDPQAVAECILVGDLALDGTVRPVRGAVAYAEYARAKGLILVAPEAMLREAHAAGVLGDCYRADTLAGIVDILTGRVPVVPVETTPVPAVREPLDVPEAWRDTVALAVAAVRLGHPVALVGPPGCGKIMVARRVADRLDATAEASTIARIYSVAGIDAPQGAPFRAPHHTISQEGLKGDRERVGECTLAHGGVLLLDDAVEFSKAAHDVVSRARATGGIDAWRGGERGVTLPARFALTLAGEPSERLDALIAKYNAVRIDVAPLAVQP